METVCEADVCTALEARCVNDEVVQCVANGSGEAVKFDCPGRPEFVSVCEERGAGEAFCTCEDDWDCPAFTVCDVDVCVGTGVSPTCSLPPEPFQNVLPANEITWGGTQQDNTAVGSPFPASGQVVLTPLVANLDDDNGDGAIDEKDFPEIIFMTFCDSANFRDDGILRAIHGGGPNKGDDFFAVCGNTVWHEGDDPNVSCSCSNTTNEADLNPTAALAVGDLDYDGIPEIVAVVTVNSPSNYMNRMLRIFDNTGEIIATSAEYNLTNNSWAPAVTIANVDNTGFAEISVGNDLFTLGTDGNGLLKFEDHFLGSEIDTGTHFLGPISCMGDIAGDDRLEIVTGAVAYSLDRPACANSLADCDAACPGPGAPPGEQAYCNAELTTLWDGGPNDGFCAIADVLGTDQLVAPGRANPLDGAPEVVLIREGHLFIYNGQDGTELRDINLNTAPFSLGQDGGAPNVDDFDGDGFPEIGTAFQVGYGMLDLQPETASCPAWNVRLDSDPTVLAPGDPGNPPRTPPAVFCVTDDDCDPDPASGFACNPATNQCVCTHNSWYRTTEDSSSRVTGSSVFDFNGDGAAEVVYNDECMFRVYDGLTGNVLFNEPSESRTRIEYPVVADVDNDGNAEIVFGVSNESGFCGGDGGDPTIEDLYNNGLEVWGDASDLWVSARRIWNQHAYHVTNVTEGGRIPFFEPKGWLSSNGRFYNTYRSNPRSFGVAPDLIVDSVQVTAATGGCGQVSDTASLSAKISNVGDLRVGPGVVVGFYGQWGSDPFVKLQDASGDLQSVLANTLEPLDSVFVTVPYDSADNGEPQVPDRIRVIVDSMDQERECIENNNDRTVEVGNSGPPAAELRVTASAPDPASCTPGPPTVDIEVFNEGNVDANDVGRSSLRGGSKSGRSRGDRRHDQRADRSWDELCSLGESAQLAFVRGGASIRGGRPRQCDCGMQRREQSSARGAERLLHRMNRDVEIVRLCLLLVLEA